MVRNISKGKYNYVYENCLYRIFSALCDINREFEIRRKVYRKQVLNRHSDWMTLIIHHMFL